MKLKQLMELMYVADGTDAAAAAVASSVFSSDEPDVAAADFCLQSLL